MNDFPDSCFIGYIGENGTYYYVYCANGGMTNGDVLSKNYKDFDGVKDLVSGGDMITLCATKEQTKYYNTENSKKILVSEELESIKYLFSVGIKNPIFAFVKNQGWYCSENMEKFFPLF